MKFTKTALGLLGGALLLSSQANAEFVRVGSLVDQDFTNYGIIENDVRFTKDNVYILDKPIYVDAGAILTIEPGTIVRGEEAIVPGVNGTLDPGVLIIGRGCKLIANGTPEEPIVFTSLEDPYVPEVPGMPSTIPTDAQQDDPLVGATAGIQPMNGDDYAPDGPTGDNGFAYDALWGGLVMLGEVRVAWENETGDDWQNSASDDPTTGGQVGDGANFIEGLDKQDGIGIYGGNADNDDNSGTVRFCSFRYAGFVIVDGNEINALTTGGVGTGTVLEFLEVFNQKDDDFEWFGGTVNSKYLAGCFGGDDGFDTDQGYQGKGQFYMLIKDNTGEREFGQNPTATGRGDRGDNMGEHDGPETDGSGNRGKPYSVWKTWNATMIGRGPGLGVPSDDNRGPNFKSGGGGSYINSIFLEFEDAGIAVDGSNPTVAPIQGFANQTGNAVERFVWERDFGGEFNAFNGAGDAGDGDSVLRNNFWWSCGVPGAVSTWDEMMQWLRHDEDDFPGNPVFGGPSNPEPLANYFLDAISGGAATVTDPYTATPHNVVELPYYQAVGAPSPSGVTGRFVEDHGNSLDTDPALVAVYRLNNNGIAPDTLDPRLSQGSPARAAGADANYDLPPNDGFYTQVSFRGAFQDNLWLKGWSIMDRDGVSSTTGLNVLSADANPATPVVSLDIDPNDDSALISFDTENGIDYSVECSQDNGKSFTPIGIVNGNGASQTVDDNGVALTSGDPIVYRVIPL